MTGQLQTQNTLYLKQDDKGQGKELRKLQAHIKPKVCSRSPWIPISGAWGPLTSDASILHLNQEAHNPASDPQNKSPVQVWCMRQGAQC